MPMIVTSRSGNNQATERCLPFLSSKKNLKLAALSNALDAMEAQNLEKIVLWDSYCRKQNTDFSHWTF
jgi:hypothetical protein